MHDFHSSNRLICARRLHTASHKLISEVRYLQSSITKTKTHITVIIILYELRFDRPLSASSNNLFILKSSKLSSSIWSIFQQCFWYLIVVQFALQVVANLIIFLVSSLVVLIQVFQNFFIPFVVKKCHSLFFWKNMMPLLRSRINGGSARSLSKHATGYDFNQLPTTSYLLLDPVFCRTTNPSTLATFPNYRNLLYFITVTSDLPLISSLLKQEVRHCVVFRTTRSLLFRYQAGYKHFSKTSVSYSYN
jgi:hypothetical protein